VPAAAALQPSVLVVSALEAAELTLPAGQAVQKPDVESRYWPA
jgi:hypothetical protein